MNKRQLAFIILLTVPAYKVITLPSFLANTAGHNAWISVMVMLLVDLATLLIAIIVWNRGGLKTILGRVGYIIVAPIFALWFVYTISIVNVEFYHYIARVFFDHNRLLSVIIPMVLVAAYIGLKGERAVGRFADFTISLLFAVVLFYILFSTADFDLSNLNPINVDEKVTLAGFPTTMWFGDFIPLIFLDVKKDKRSNVWLWGAGIVAIVLTVSFYIVFIALFGEAAKYINEAFPRVMTFNMITPHIGRLHWPALVLLIMGATVKSGILLIASFNILRKVAGGKAVKIFAPISIIIITYLIKEITTGSFASYKDASVMWIAIFINYLMPLVLLVLSLIKGKKQCKQKS